MGIPPSYTYNKKKRYMLEVGTFIKPTNFAAFLG